MMSLNVAERLRAMPGRFSRFIRNDPASLAPAKAKQNILGLPVVAWPNEPQTVEASCPNCGATDPKSLLLSIDFATLPGSRKITTVLRCPACTCLYYAAQIPPDYAEDAMLERGRVPFYLQQGAGLSLITRPLAQLRAGAGSTYAEVGCGFGFGLDYALHAKHWTGQGIDPGAIAALGAQMLGISIDRRYLQDQEPELAGTRDVVMSSETIEHVLSPKNFINALRSMLRPGGVLVLTTPDGADLRPDMAPAVLVGLLSPGLHLIFQTRDSLHTALSAAGFTHIDVTKDGHSLVAFASDQPLELEGDHTALRTEYRNYLEHRARDFPPEHDLYLAFAGRAFQESVNDGAFDQAARIRPDLDAACRRRFGSRILELGKAVTDYHDLPLEDLATRIPLSLGGLLYADAILALSSGKRRAALAQRFTDAANAAEVLRVALGDLALADGMTEEIAWTARAEALLCAASAGDKAIIAKLAQLPPAPSAETGAQRKQVIAERTLVEMVNAGHYEIAETVAVANHFHNAPWADPGAADQRTDSQRDALFCLAILDSQSEDPIRIDLSYQRFHCLRRILEAQPPARRPPGLFDAICNGEVNALHRLGRHDDATAVLDLTVNRHDD